MQMMYETFHFIKQQIPFVNHLLGGNSRNNVFYIHFFSLSGF